MRPTPAVFLVDPDRTTQKSVGYVTNAMNLECESFTCGQEFLESYKSDRLSCVILEVKIPTVSGLDIQSTLALQHPSPPVIFLTSHGTVSIAVRAMRAGAIQFLEKPARENELWDALHCAVDVGAARRREWLRRRQIAESLEKLTPKERAILSLIAKGKTKRAMATEIKACVRTVELHQARLRKKLKLETSMQLVRFGLLVEHMSSRATSLDGNGGGLATPEPVPHIQRPLVEHMMELGSSRHE